MMDHCCRDNSGVVNGEWEDLVDLAGRQASHFLTVKVEEWE
jgi:hypothetical protein